ncbi:aldo/keto reductase [Methylocella sp.]|uniref:aldo/keto reductase n=1 Tax=Methylocella sp. TaxID=1978226 RepID=UPI003784DD16
MRTVFCPGLDRGVSALGFGCAQLGSLVSENQSRRLLDQAFDRGVTWFEIGPTDGDGEAEATLGRFLKGRREDAVVVARLGSRRPTTSPLSRLLLAFRRGAFAAFPEFGSSSFKGLRTPSRAPLRAERFESALEDSLRRLQTDHVDILLIDDPGVDACRDPHVLDALASLKASGRAKLLGVAGAPDAIEAARACGHFSVFETRSNPFDRTIERVRAGAPPADGEFLVLAGALDKAYEKLSQLLVGDGGRLASLASQLAYGPPFMTAEILLDYAFGENPTGVVAIVMSQAAHVDQNCARAARPPRSDVVEFVNKTVLAASAQRAHGRP